MQLEYFQLIDRIERLSVADGTITCSTRVPTEASIFEGHFPGHPLLPGVLLVECMAQTSGYLLLALNRFTRLPFLCQIGQAKLRTFVPPDTELEVEGKLEHDGSGYAVTKGRVIAAGRAIADAELRFRTMPFPSDKLRDTVQEHAQKVGLEFA